MHTGCFFLFLLPERLSIGVCCLHGEVDCAPVHQHSRSSERHLFFPAKSAWSRRSSFFFVHFLALQLEKRDGVGDRAVNLSSAHNLWRLAKLTTAKKKTTGIQSIVQKTVANGFFYARSFIDLCVDPLSAILSREGTVLRVTSKLIIYFETWRA